jgi:hypothetical protein
MAVSKLGLNIPIRQGQTRYQYLVMQFSREEEITAELNMSEFVFPNFPLVGLDKHRDHQRGNRKIRPVRETLRETHFRGRIERLPCAFKEENR